MATTTGAEAAEATTKRRLWPEISGGQVTGLLYASIWLVFLAMPVVATVLSDAALGWKLVSYGATAAFALVYTWLMAWWMIDEALGPGPLSLVTAGVVLGGLASLSVPAAGGWSAVFIPFIAALVIFTTEPLPGIPVGVLVWAVPTGAAYVFVEQEFWMILGPGFGMLFIIVSRVTEHFDARARAAQDQLNQVDERDRIARDVHDVLGHSLTVLSIKAQLVQRLMDTDQARARAELDDIEQLSRESLDQVRSTVTRLRAPQLPAELDVARSALEAGGITAEIRADESSSESPLLAWALRETVTNVLRHSEASRCLVELSRGMLRVSDDGVGISSTEGHGLRGLRERARAAGAQVRIDTPEEHSGTRVEVSLK